jgi:hypothetical protein
MSEIWKTVPSLPQYEASSLGRVRLKEFEAPMPHGGVRTYGGRATYGDMRQDKGRYFVLYRGKNYAVHRMVCEAFHGPQPAPYPKAVCTHLNGKKTDNRPENLAWRSQQQNMNDPEVKRYHMSRVGLMNPVKRRIPDALVREIRTSTESNVAIAARLGFSPSAISNIRARRARASVADA